MAEEEKKEQRTAFHKVFLISIFLKGINGALEVIGGFFWLLFYYGQVNRFVLWITKGELSEDPKDIIANYLVSSAGSLSLSVQLFLAFYLFSHGFIKIILVISLWRKKLWAYPAIFVFLSIFIFYQLYRIVYARSLWLIPLTFFDILIVFLVQREYKNLKNQQRAL